MQDPDEASFDVASTSAVSLSFDQTAVVDCACGNVLEDRRRPASSRGALTIIAGESFSIDCNGITVRL